MRSPALLNQSNNIYEIFTDVVVGLPDVIIPHGNI